MLPVTSSRIGSGGAAVFGGSCAISAAAGKPFDGADDVEDAFAGTLDAALAALVEPALATAGAGFDGVLPDGLDAAFAVDAFAPLLLAVAFGAAGDFAGVAADFD